MHNLKNINLNKYKNIPQISSNLFLDIIFICLFVCFSSLQISILKLSCLSLPAYRCWIYIYNKMKIQISLTMIYKLLLLQ